MTWAQLLIVPFILCLVAIFYFAGKAARRGERYVGSGRDAIEQYEDEIDSTYIAPGGWGRNRILWPGWRQRVRDQARKETQAEADETVERHERETEMVIKRQKYALAHPAEPEPRHHAHHAGQHDLHHRGD